MSTVSWAVNTIEKYNVKVKKYIKRTRGNPPDVLEAYALIRGGRFCEICNVHDTPKSFRSTIHLHHKDGNWKNYKLQNLIFVCSKCHIESHEGCWSTKPCYEEKQMSKQNKMAWSGAYGNTLLSKVQEYTRNGSSKRQAFRQISSESDTLFGRRMSVKGISTAYYGVTRRRKNKGFDFSSESVFPMYGLTMTSQDAYEFYKFARDCGITIIK